MTQTVFAKVYSSLTSEDFTQLTLVYVCFFVLYLDPPTVKTLSSTVTTHRNDGPRKSLNLSDYKKRRGLI